MNEVAGCVVNITSIPTISQEAKDRLQNVIIVVSCVFCLFHSFLLLALMDLLQSCSLAFIKSFQKCSFKAKLGF